MLVNRLPRLLPLAVGFALLAGCGSAVQEPESAPVPPPVPDSQLSDVVLRVGDQKGNQRSLLAAADLLDTPYEIEWATFTSGPALLEAVAAEAVDVGGVGNTPPLFAAAASSPISVVSASQENAATDAVLVPGGSSLEDVTDLRGKTIGVPKGSSAHGNVLNLLAAANMSVDDVDLAFMQPAEGYSALTQRQIDAWATWDPYTAQAELESDVQVLADGAETANGYQFEVASNDSLASPAKNAAIGDFVQRIAEAQRYNHEHTEERARAWSAETGIAFEVTHHAANRRHQLPVPLNRELVESEQQLADAFIEAEEIPTRFRFADFVDRRFEQQVVNAR